MTQSTTGDVATDGDVRFAVVAVADFPGVVPGIAPGDGALTPDAEWLRGPLPVERVLRWAIDRGRGAGPVLFEAAGAAGAAAAAAVVGVARVCLGARGGGGGAGVAIGSGGATVS
ncbi:MAG: hypothetical protein ACOVRP_05330 [Gemmatimonas sp.]